MKRMTDCRWDARRRARRNMMLCRLARYRAHEVDDLIWSSFFGDGKTYKSMWPGFGLL